MTVADASPIPVILYSVPGFTGVEISAEVACLTSTHPNIIGMKDSGGNVSRLLESISYHIYLIK